MIKKLLILMASCALISAASFTGLHLIGGWGFKPGFWGDSHSDWAIERGPDTTRDLPFNGAEQLDINVPAEIVLTQGAQPKFTVTGPKDLLDELNLDGGTLTGPDGHHFHFRRHHGRLRIDIVSPNTHDFQLSGAEKLTLRNYDQDSLTVHASGAADIEGAGRAKRLEMHISGAGHIDLSGLPVDEANVTISGAGNAELDAHHSADISISGAGHVELRARPPIFRQHISGFGSIDAPDAPASSTPAPEAAPPAKSKV